MIESHLKIKITDNSDTIKALLLGFAILFLIYLPIIILNFDMKAIIHDEFDGDFLTYILRSEHLSDETLPELFNGADKSSMTAPAPGFIVLFILFSPRVAFFLMYSIVALTAYIGMFFSLRELDCPPYITISVAILFSMLPFYPVYGLSVMGQPLLFFAFLLLLKGKRRIVAYSIIAFFAITSSPVLVGYADIVVYAIVIVVAIIKTKRALFTPVMGWLELIMVYALTNIPLIKSIFFNKGFISHRAEHPLYFPARERILSVFFDGMYHAASLHKLIIIVTFLVLVIAVLFSKMLSCEEKKKLVLYVVIFIIAILIACFAGYWSWKPTVDLRWKLGGIFTYFQVDRFYWLYPFIWYTLLGMALYFIHVLLKQKKTVSIILIMMILLANFTYIGMNSTILANLRAIQGEYNKSAYASVDEFFQPEMFNGIEEYIGLPQNSYSVCCVGLYPSIPLYNGFYCIDGYSNNYSLEYKHKFRHVIENELEKDSKIKEYFDNWGNRCYVFSSELGLNYYWDKKGSGRCNHLDINIGMLKKMNCKYLFSSVPINNSDLRKDKVMHSETSYYDVYIYSIIEQ